jgi:hypothetical protein
METSGNGGEGAGKNARRRYRRRLSSAKNIRTALQDVYRRLDEGGLETKKARALAYILLGLANVVASSAFEERIGALERRDREAAARGEGRLAS